MKLKLVAWFVFSNIIYMIYVWNQPINSKRFKIETKANIQSILSFELIKRFKTANKYKHKMTYNNQSINQCASSACLVLGLRLYLSSSSTTCFCRLLISPSRALSVCSSMATVCFNDSMVSGKVCSTRTPPTTFQHFLSPFKG